MPERVSQVDPDVRNVLACPACKDRPKLDATDDDRAFRCPTCKRRYPIVNGIPQLTAEDGKVDG